MPIALTTWLLSLRNVNVESMGDLGLAEVLPIAYWAAAAVLIFGFCAALRDRHTPAWLYAGYLLALIAMLHATTPLLYSQLSFAWAWKHVSMVDVFVRLGELPIGHDPGLDVYSYWSGFFAFNAMVVEATGVDSALSYAAWAPLVADALLLGPLIMLYRSFSRSRRLSWAAAWVFYISNWVAQDYFAPQMFTFLLYVCVVAVVVRRLPPHASATGKGVEAARRPSLSWVLLVLLIVAAMVCSHPLTPVMLIFTLIALAVPRRNRGTVLPVLLGTVVLTVTWSMTVARTFVSANLKHMAQEITEPGTSASSALLNLSDASSGQVLVAWTGRGLSAGVWLLAITALVLRPALRRTALPLLAVAPLVLLALNSYENEMLFRAYMFTLPAISFAAAALLVGGRRPHSWARVLVLPLTLAVIFASFSLSYYGKEYSHYFTRAETAASNWLFSHAPHGSMIAGLTEDFPAGYTNYDRYQRLWITMLGPTSSKEFAAHPADALRKLAVVQEPVYLMLNRAQEARIHATGSLPTSLQKIDKELASQTDFRVVYRNNDAVVYLFMPPKN